MTNGFKQAFSLTEALIFLLISSLVIVATMPLITIRHIKLPDRAPHGKWACKLINGEMYSATAANVNQKLPPDNKWKKGCTFPELPASVSYIIVQAIGGGAAGRQGSMSVGMDNKTDDLFPTGENQSVYTIEETGKYKVYFPGEIGKKGVLYPSYFDVILGGYKFMSCAFDSAYPNETVASVTFEYDFKRGDKLVLSSESVDVTNKLNNMGERLCRREAVASWIDQDGVEHTGEPYQFAEVTHSPGKNGKLRTLSLKEETGFKDLVKIKGSGGGFYASSSDSCEIDCSNRYSSSYDRASWSLNEFITTYGLENVQKSFSSNKTAKITSQGHTLSYYGGCGGAAGQVNTVLIEKPDKKDFNIRIGRGGVYDSSRTDGEDTVFDYIVASGGLGCADKGVNASFDGQDGGKATTMATLDSVPGKGGKGKIGSPVPSVEEMNGKSASGFGSGGGGGGFALNINNPLEDYLNNAMIYQLENYKVLGDGGNGASGGIIVSW